MTTTAELDARYGRNRSPRRRRVLWWIVGVVAVAATIWLGVTTLASTADSVRADGVAYTVVDEHAVEVRFQVVGPAGRDMACALEALDDEFGVVGWRILEIPAADTHTQAFTERIPTYAEAATGFVNECWVI